MNERLSAYALWSQTQKQIHQTSNGHDLLQTWVLYWSNGSAGGCKWTDSQRDGRYQMYYLQALLSYTADEDQITISFFLQLRISKIKMWLMNIERSLKASADKIAIFVFFIWTPQHFTYFGWTFEVKFFSGVYHAQDTRDEKVSLVLPHGEHGEIQPLDPSGIHFSSRVSWGW